MAGISSGAATTEHAATDRPRIPSGVSTVSTTRSIAGARQIDRSLSVWTLILATSINEAMLLILPSFVGALGDSLRLSADRTGLLASADLIGIALSTATGPFWLRRVSWRRVGLGALVSFMLCNAVCFGVRQFGPLFALRILTGLVAGVGYTVGLAGVLGTSRAARNAGLLVVVQVIFSGLGLYLLDVVPVHWRLDSVYAYIVIWTVPCLVFGWSHYPEDPGERAPAGRLDWKPLALRGSAVIAGAGFYFLMIGGVWGYMEGIAREAGLSLVQTGEALSVGLAVSLVGAAAAAYLGLRFGRVGPLVAAAVVQIGSLYLLTRLKQFGDVLLAFYLINALFQIVWSYIIPYFMVMFAEVEPTGRFVSLYGASTHLTLAVGPYVGAFFVARGRHEPLLWWGIVLLSLSFGAFLLAVWLGRPRPGISSQGLEAPGTSGS